MRIECYSLPAFTKAQVRLFFMCEPGWSWVRGSDMNFLEHLVKRDGSQPNTLSDKVKSFLASFVTDRGATVNIQGIVDQLSSAGAVESRIGGLDQFVLIKSEKIRIIRDALRTVLANSSDASKINLQ